MNASDVLAALALPPESRVAKRVPKKLPVENGAPTAADKRQINDGIEELLWLAALKPTTIGVSEYRDAVREYLEIAVLSLVLRPVAKAGRLLELIHRAIPYPVLLTSQQSDVTTLSLAHKRLARNEAGKVVLDDTVIVCELSTQTGEPTRSVGLSPRYLLDSLALTSQPRTHLLALYQGWIDCLQAFQAGHITGRFVLPSSIAAANARREALAQHDRLTRQIAALRSQAEHESQLNLRVELNLEIKRLEADLADAKRCL